MIHFAVYTLQYEQYLVSLSSLSVSLPLIHLVLPSLSRSKCCSVSAFQSLSLSFPILSKKSVSLPLTHLVLPSLSPSLPVFHSFLFVFVSFTLPLPHSFSLKNFVYKYDKCSIISRGNALCVHILLYQTLHLFYSGMFINPSGNKTVFYQDSNRLSRWYQVYL